MNSLTSALHPIWILRTENYPFFTKIDTNSGDESGIKTAISVLIKEAKKMVNEQFIN